MNALPSISMRKRLAYPIWEEGLFLVVRSFPAYIAGEQPHV